MVYTRQRRGYADDQAAVGIKFHFEEFTGL
jgi:hypothetical protein